LPNRLTGFLPARKVGELDVRFLDRLAARPMEGLGRERLLVRADGIRERTAAANRWSQAA